MFDKRRPDNDISEQRKAQNFSSGGATAAQIHHYRCLDCNNAWIAEDISACPKCGSEEVTRCSEFLYERLKSGK